jgi:hypothetical protein
MPPEKDDTEQRSSYLFGMPLLPNRVQTATIRANVVRKFHESVDIFS